MNINHSYGEQCDSKDWLVLYSMFVHGVKAMDLYRSMVKAPLPPVFDSLQAVVSRGGLAIWCQAGKRTDVGSIPCFGHCFSSRALSCRVGALQISIISIITCGHCLTVLPLTINETLKWLTPVLICRGVHRVTDLEKFPVRISKMKLQCRIGLAVTVQW